MQLVSPFVRRCGLLLSATVWLGAADVAEAKKGRFLVVNNCRDAIRLLMPAPGGTNTLSVPPKVTGVWSRGGVEVEAELPREVFVEADGHRFVVFADSIGDDGYVRLEFDDKMLRQAVEASMPPRVTPPPSRVKPAVSKKNRERQTLPKALMRGRMWTVKEKRFYASVTGLEKDGKVRLRRESGNTTSASVADMELADELFLKEHASDWLERQKVRLPSDQPSLPTRRRVVRTVSPGSRSSGGGYFSPGGRSASRPRLRPMPTSGTANNTGQMLTVIGATLASKFVEGQKRDAVPQTRNGVELVSLTPKQFSSGRTIREYHERHDPLLKANVHTPVDRTIRSYGVPSVMVKLRNKTSRSKTVKLQLFLGHDHVASFLAPTGEYVTVNAKVPAGKTVEVTAVADRWDSSLGLKKRIKITNFEVR